MPGEELSPISVFRWKPLIGTLSLCVVSLAPFLHKAANIDDPLFLATAEQIRRRWWDFYGFTYNWFGMPLAAPDVIKNPPLTGYYLALTTSIAGESEVALHLALWVPALLTVVGVYILAGRLCSRPALATAIATLSVVFVVSATTLMCDLTMTCCWVWALVCWLRGLHGGGQRWSATTGVLVLLAAMAKYFGACLIPLLLFWTLLQPGRRRRTLWMLLPSVGLLMYQLYTRRLYGQGLVGNAIVYTAGLKNGSSWHPHVLAGLSFLGGCMLTALPVAGFSAAVSLRAAALSRGLSLLVAAAFLAGILYWDLPGIRQRLYVDQIPGPLMAQLIVFSVGEALLVWTALDEVWRARRVDSLMLAAWIFGTLLFTVELNWTVSARNLLPVAPAVAVMVVRRLDGQVLNRTCESLLWTGVLAAGVLAMFVARADSLFANAAREASDQLRTGARLGHRTVWFEGHWGFQYYMQQWGAKPIDQTTTRCLPGEVIVVPSLNVNLVQLPDRPVRLLQRIVTQARHEMAATDLTLGAGFYSDLFGPLPFAFGAPAPDTYDIYGVEQPLRFTPGRTTARVPGPGFSMRGSSIDARFSEH